MAGTKSPGLTSAPAMAVDLAKMVVESLGGVKKKENFSSVEYFTYDEGECVQCMHIGPYDLEPETVTKMHEYMISEGYELDINETRFHHEIYISDVRKTEPEKLKTVIRHPIKKKI